MYARFKRYDIIVLNSINQLKSTFSATLEKSKSSSSRKAGNKGRMAGNGHNQYGGNNLFQ